MCTDARIIARDGTIVSARTMEFALPLGSRLVLRPRGSRLTSPAPGGGSGLSWEARFGSCYLDSMGADAASDGLNEAGLGIGALYLPGETEYEQVPADEQSTALSNALFCQWVLARFGTVNEVKEGLRDVRVWGEPQPLLGGIAVPLHFVVHDDTGASMVLEWLAGRLHVHDSAVGVLTNCPTFDWHLANLRNYANLTPVNVSPTTVDGLSFASLGQGSGLLGLPGDPTPPSRFVQTAATLHLAIKPADAREAITLAQKILNRVDIPIGLTRDPGPDGVAHGDRTQWAVIRDHTNRTMYWRSYHDMTLRCLDLKDAPLSPGDPIRRTPIERAEPTVISVSADEMSSEAA